MHSSPPTAHPAKAPLITRTIWWFLVFALVSNVSLSLLFAVIPLFASTSTGNSLAAGLATGAMMLATVITELGTPRLMSALGYRRIMAIGVALLGFPALALMASSHILVVLAVCLARGAGLAIVVVAGTALAAQLFPVERRAEGLGLYGVAVSIPGMLCLPLGVWLADTFGFDLVFGLTAIAAVIGLVTARTLPDLHPGEKSPIGILAELGNPAILRPTVIFGLATLAIGILLTYLALAVPEDARNIAAIALLVQAICTTCTRWAAGRLGDRIGSHNLLAPSMLVAAIGMLCIVATGNSWAIIGGMALFGLGFGGAQNASLAIMFERAPRDRFAQISVIWNLAYDAGMGIGAVGFGLVSQLTGYPWGFAIVAAILFASVIPSWLDRTPPHIETISQPLQP